MADKSAETRWIANDSPRLRINPLLCCLTIAVIVTITAYGAFAEDRESDDGDRSLARDFRYGAICTATARAARRACRSEVMDDFWTTIGNCANLSDPIAASECTDDAKSARREDRSLCSDRFGARLELCYALGEDAFDPSFDPADFVDPMEIGVTVAANPFFPLEQSRSWV